MAAAQNLDIGARAISVPEALLISEDTAKASDLVS